MRALVFAASVFAISTTLATRPAHAQDVLVLSDGDTAAVEAALTDAGFLVTVAPGLEDAYSGDPDPADYCAVVHLNGDSYATGMPIAGQQALQTYVDEGGGFIGMEWNAYEQDSQLTMRDMPELILTNRTSGHEGQRQYNITAAGLDHPVTAGLPDTFVFSSGFNDGPCDAGQDVEVLATEGAVGAGGVNDGVCVREWGLGRIVNFNHAGNYMNYATFDDENIRTLLAQAVGWACGGGAGSRPVADAGPGYTVDEGAEVTLDGTGTIDDGSALTFTWDLDGDGQYDDADVEDPVFSATALDGPSTATVRLRVTSAAGRSSSAFAEVTVVNVPPGVPGQISPKDGACLESRTVQLTTGAAVDVAADSLLYRFDLWRDEAMTDFVAFVPIEPGLGVNPVTIETELPADGNSFYWRVRASDDDDATGLWSPLRELRVACGADGDADADADGDTDADGDGDTDADADADADADTDADGDLDGDDDDDGREDVSGCCAGRTGGGTPVSSILLAGLSLGTLRRRRRRF